MKKIFIYDVDYCNITGETTLYETHKEVVDSGLFDNTWYNDDNNPNLVGYVDVGNASRDYIQVYKSDKFRIIDDQVNKEFKLTHPTEQNMRTVQHALRMTNLEYLTEIEGNFKSVTFKII